MFASASDAATIARGGNPRTAEATDTVTILPSTATAAIPRTISGSSTRLLGSTSMPIDTKKTTANTSRSGKTSAIVRCE